MGKKKKVDPTKPWWEKGGPGISAKYTLRAYPNKAQQKMLLESMKVYGQFYNEAIQIYNETHELPGYPLVPSFRNRESQNASLTSAAGCRDTLVRIKDSVSGENQVSNAKGHRGELRVLKPKDGVNRIFSNIPNANFSSSEKPDKVGFKYSGFVQTDKHKFKIRFPLCKGKTVEGLRCRGSIPYDVGEYWVTQCSIIYDAPVDEWKVNVTVRIDPEAHRKRYDTHTKTKQIAIDFGVKHFATISDQDVNVTKIPPIRHKIGKFVKLQKHYSRVAARKGVRIEEFSELPRFRASFRIGQKILFRDIYARSVEEASEIARAEFPNLGEPSRVVPAGPKMVLLDKTRGYEKAQKKKAKFEQRIRNIRLNRQHTLSRKLVNESTLIVTEDLNLKALLSKKKNDGGYDVAVDENGNVKSKNRSQQKGLHRNMKDEAIAQMKNMLIYKSEWTKNWGSNSTTFILTPKNLAATQTCSECGEKCGPKGKEGLGVREWVCSCCGAEHDRDVNATQVMLNWARYGVPAKIMIETANKAVDKVEGRQYS